MPISPRCEAPRARADPSEVCAAVDIRPRAIAHHCVGGVLGIPAGGGGIRHAADRNILRIARRQTGQATRAVVRTATHGAESEGTAACLDVTAAVSGGANQAFNAGGVRVPAPVPARATGRLRVRAHAMQVAAQAQKAGIATDGDVLTVKVEAAWLACTSARGLGGAAEGEQGDEQSPKPSQVIGGLHSSGASLGGPNSITRRDADPIGCDVTKPQRG
jgi:hypothetical protein